jgi:hypothetical protein
MRNDHQDTNSGDSQGNSKYEVVVGSLGTVYSGNSCMRASMTFIEQSRAGDDVVVFFENGEIKRHFVGSNGVTALARWHISSKNTAFSFRRCAQS